MNMQKETKRIEIDFWSIGINDSRGIYQQSLFDPVQTHGVYGLTESTVWKVKEYLKSKGATRFRKLNANGKGYKILCYKAPNCKAEKEAKI